MAGHSSRTRLTYSRDWQHGECHRQLVCHAAHQSVVIDDALVEAINEVSNKSLRAMLANSEAMAREVTAELKDMRAYLEAEDEADSARFLAILQGMLQHTVLKNAGCLEGVYKQAFDRLCNQLAGSDWKLTEEGKATSVPEEPKFSTWEEALGGKRKAGTAGSGNGGASAAAANRRSLAEQAGPVEDELYRVLGVATSASATEIKSAYRQKALKLHPDVNSADDAEEQFLELSNAYDTLSDSTARALYDQYGLEGMRTRQGAQAGRGNASRAWDEFKPYKRENKRTKARDASRASASMDGRTETPEADRVAVMGDVVEYPLTELVRSELQDGRTHGVGLLVGRNIDRGDAAKLSADVLDLCEVEPMRQEDPDSNRWIPDELGVSSFPKLYDLKTIPVAEYDGRFDVWVIDAPLSDGCGGPDLPEEIML
ncbi:hypothetical protein WJX72_004542 [[Myrmecia] bisecta]|uniref:J domain-containing protein n=1 Tax=[Myrmecia] bisecta TaxID=41462 RepID=A0AAW1Q900_9CHLO